MVRSVVDASRRGDVIENGLKRTNLNVNHDNSWTSVVDNMIFYIALLLPSGGTPKVGWSASATENMAQLSANNLNIAI